MSTIISVHSFRGGTGVTVEVARSLDVPRMLLIDG